MAIHCPVLPHCSALTDDLIPGNNQGNPGAFVSDTTSRETLLFTRLGLGLNGINIIFHSPFVLSMNVHHQVFFKHIYFLTVETLIQPDRAAAGAAND
jgi:hypothetical protein